MCLRSTLVPYSHPVSLVGNVCLFYSTGKYITRSLQTSFLLIFSLIFVHLIKNLVANTMKIVYASGFVLDSAGCKVMHFMAALMTSVAIWFMLHFAVLCYQKLDQTVHPSSEAPNLDHQIHSLKVASALWELMWWCTSQFYFILENLNT